MIKFYTLAFIFDALGRVALICKNRPESLAGKWNGIGGKVEPSDLDLYSATVRELKEEAGIDIAPEQLKQVAIYSTDSYEIRVTAALVERLEVATLTDEEVRLFEYTKLFEDGAGLLLDPHAMLFLQAAYIAVTAQDPWIHAVITNRKP